MRVLIDTTAVRYPHSGTGVYVERLAEALGPVGVEVVEPPQRPRGRPGGEGARRNLVRSARNLTLDRGWLRDGLPAAAEAAGADVIHHPLPAWCPHTGHAQVVTVHDVAYEALRGHFDPFWRRIARREHQRAAQSANAVVCVSRTTAEEARTLLGADPARIVVAPHGPGQALSLPARSARHFLYVGDDEPRKDLGGLLDAYRRYRRAVELPLPLVLVGRSAHRAGAEGVEGEPAADTERLAALFGATVALVHPSRHEGFGLTTLEAMAAGVPVVAVANRGIEETVGEAGLIVAPEELTGALERVGAEPGLRERLSRAGRARAADFSWERSAIAHREAYERAAAQRRSADSVPPSEPGPV